MRSILWLRPALRRRLWRLLPLFLLSVVRPVRRLEEAFRPPLSLPFGLPPRLRRLWRVWGGLPARGPPGVAPPRAAAVAAVRWTTAAGPAVARPTAVTAMGQAECPKGRPLRRCPTTTEVPATFPRRPR